ncbi:MAG: hypothetical protein ACRES9_05390 [Gammaproteobacteria bacterium]
MILIPALILAGALNAGISAAPPASSASFAVQAEARLNRLTAAAASVLHRQTVTRALAAGNRRLSADLTRTLAASRPKAEKKQSDASAARARRAKATLDRLTAAEMPRLHRLAVTRALAAGNRRLNADLVRMLKTSRPEAEEGLADSTARARRAKATLDRLTAAEMPRLRRRAVARALATGNRRLNAELARTLVAASRPTSEPGSQVATEPAVRGATPLSE